ncbi:hypothetical protein CROQUDRAFT_50181 [Cronartium quercuum f. sp. fusiforme G11]|uniref:RRM domain-containing protein n=1 Tax=Cronartium quercuum f. sp. fusiforme G11 TaxID=708437 RepID=A0A9P6N9L8_9BASI|nr:hypothetical protein CROQUDRAFT_50181 [Cronartium quercuum f. sp. fusiforme G11]
MANPVSPVFLTKPILHVSGISAAVPDADMITALHECLRARLHINRGGSKWEETTGIVEFEKLDNAEKAYATLHNYYFTEHQCTLKLSHSSDPTADPKPSAKIRLVKFLPPDITPGRLFSLFRPFGPIYRVALNYIRTQPDIPVFSGTAVIEFYDEGQASLAQIEMHCADVQGHTIAIELYDEKRDRAGRATTSMHATPGSPSRWAQATPFVPSSQPSDNAANVSRWANAQNQIQPYHHHHYPISAPLSPQQDLNQSPTSRWTMSPETPQNRAHLSPTALAQMGKKQIDPCNLFIKGLGADVDSGDLFHAFKKFGTIVSARVMKNEVTGISKQFGFVSFSTEAATAAALEAMDGTTIGRTTNKIVVRLHELKKYKEGRTKVVSVTSPLSPNEGSVRSGVMSRHGAMSPRASRAGSIDTRTDVQMAEVLANMMELNRLQPSMSLMGSPAIEPSTRSESRFAVSPPPGHPQQSMFSGDQMSSRHSPTPSTVALTPLSEREKILTAVLKLNDHSIGEGLDEVVDLLMGLPTKERKLCLFNPQVLATKVCEAKEILAAPDEVQNIVKRPIPIVPAPTLHVSTASQSISLHSPVATPARPPPVKTAPLTTVPSNGIGSPAKAAPPPPARYLTISDVAKLPSKEIIELISSSSPLVHADVLPKFDSMVKQETDDWIDTLALMSTHQQKQKLGEKVFKTLRGFGIKGCPKLTVELLDSEDLRSLAHLMNSFPDILKQKVMIKTTA